MHPQRNYNLLTDRRHFTTTDTWRAVLRRMLILFSSDAYKRISQHPKNQKPRREINVKKTLVTILGLTLLTVSAYSAAIPFSENFDSYDNTSNPAIVPTEFSEIRGTDYRAG